MQTIIIIIIIQLAFPEDIVAYKLFNLQFDP